MGKRIIIGCVLVLLIGLADHICKAQNRGPSTPEERKRAVDITNLLENDPFNKDAKTLSRQLLVFLIEVPDIQVHICTNVLGDYKKIKGETLRQLQRN